MPLKHNGHWLISVGELSGDLLGAQLVRSLKEVSPELQFSGITGPALVEEGVQTIASLNELNVMGITEVMKKLACICMLKQWLLECVDRHQIKVAILVDFAGFHLKLAEELRMRGVYVIQYVAPKLWAWGEHRMGTLKKNINLLLATFPFEEEYFKKHGLNCHYVGCPIVQRTDAVKTTKQELGFSSDQAVFAFLPGSRAQEVQRLLEPMLSIAQKVKELLPHAEFVIPIASSLRDEKHRQYFLSHQQKSVHFVERNSLDIMSGADAALVASGTATLECALVMTPLAVIYSMNALSYAFAKRKVQVAWASLVNILSSKLLVEEFIQDFDHLDVAKSLVSLIEDSEKSQKMLAEFTRLRGDLSGSGALNTAHYIHKALADYV